MNQQRAPWLMSLAAAVVALLFSRGSPAPSTTPLSGAPVPGAAASRQEEMRRAVTSGQGSHEAKNTWAPFVRLFDEFFGTRRLSSDDARRVRGTWGEQQVNLGISTVEQGAGRPDLARIAANAKKAKYDLDFLIALVPDPIDSRLPANFDLTVAGLQMGLTRAKFLLDRRWLPWTAPEVAGENLEEEAAHNTAGLLLFRTVESARDDEPEPESQCLLAVFLVGETSKGGIHRQAFEQTVEFITGLQQAPASSSAMHACRKTAEGNGSPRPFQEIRVLGPSFSGSAESLRAAMESFAPRPFRVVTGSATREGLEEYFNSTEVTFSRTVVPDDVLKRKAFCFLQRDLGWDLHYAALLTEDDTAYGMLFNADHPAGAQVQPPDPPADPCDEPDGKEDDEDSGRLMEPMIEMRFPSGLSAIRNAWEESGAGRGADRAYEPGKELTIGRPKTALELSLADRGSQANSILELSPLTSRIDEMAMANLLRTVSRYGIRYVGIVATDLKDEIFLAEQVRRWAPDVILFLFESNLIYVHPHVQPALYGSLAITSFPLLTSGPVPQQKGDVRQLGSEVQEGVSRAAQCLLEIPLAPPAVWIAATGKDTMSPVGRQEIDAAAFMDPCPRPEPPENPWKSIIFPEVSDLQLLLLLAFVCVLSYWLGKRSSVDRSSAIGPRVLLILGNTVICVVGAGIVVLALLPLHAPDSFLGDVRQLREGPHAILLGAIVLAYFYLHYRAVRAASGFLGRRPGWKPWLSNAAITVAALVSGALLYWAIEECIVAGWSLGQPGFFYLRVRRFANGLSPFVSLGWLAGALVVWLSIELKRHQLRLRYQVPWPIPGQGDGAEPAFKAHPAVTDIEALLTNTFPRRPEFWILVAVAVVPACALLWNITQPLADPLAYGRIFVSVLLLVFVLSVVSFHRFLKTWLLVRQVLGRLEHTRCRRCFAAISGIVQWNAMRSFVWYAPSFRSLAQEVERLAELERRGPSLVQDEASEAAAQLEAAFSAEARGSFAEEVAARDEVPGILARAGQRLAAAGFDQEVQQLQALRVVGYLRHVFGQLRYALMGAMVPALLLIVAVNSYAFVPRRLMLLLFWAAVLAASAVSLGVFVQMDRDVVLSEIGGTPPGRVTLDRAFLSNIFAYAVLPLLALISSQVPQVGQLFGHWLDPLTRLLEVG
jgi:hypothetical protein